MSKLPSISDKNCTKALQKLGFYLKRRESSHVILRRDNPFAQVVVPDHQELAKGTLRAILRDVDLSVEEFSDYYRAIAFYLCYSRVRSDCLLPSS